MKKAIIITAILGMGAFVYYKVKEAMKVCYNFAGIKLGGVGKTTNLTATIEIKNKGNASFTLKKIEIDVFSADKFLGKIYTQYDTDILPNTAQKVDLATGLNTVEFLKDATTILLSNKLKNIPVSFKGKITVKMGIVSHSLPINENFTMGELFNYMRQPETC
jgi:LEA14-like dessication related protein